MSCHILLRQNGEGYVRPGNTIVDFGDPLRCTCSTPDSGFHTHQNCVYRSTEEDGLCDTCREWRSNNG